jgi:hypothetical protein
MGATDPPAPRRSWNDRTWKWVLRLVVSLRDAKPVVLQRTITLKLLTKASK